MEIKSLSVQELNVIATYLIHDKRDKSITFNHKSLSDLGLRLFNEVNPEFQKAFQCSQTPAAIGGVCEHQKSSSRAIIFGKEHWLCMKCKGWFEQTSLG